MKKPQFSIRTDVPIPPPRRPKNRGRTSAFPFSQLEVGHSFCVPHPSDEGGLSPKEIKLRVARAVVSANSAARKAGKAVRFQWGEEADAVCVWRIS